ncbi:MAG: protein kinase [Archangium sp.]|nr:protein kinase [Archangium sp.]
MSPEVSLIEKFRFRRKASQNPPFVGTYRITRKLGAGALVEGYVGMYRSASEQPVWLKRLVQPWARDVSFLERFHPVATQWRYAPPGVLAPLVEFGIGADQTWVTQAISDGESMRAVLSACATRQLKPTANEIAAVGLRAAAALASLHEAATPACHGDVCASTVHLTLSGGVVLTDFGIARAAGANAQTGPARSEALVMAPEQVVGPPGPPADVYRLGLVLLELVTGRSTLPTGPVSGVPEKLGQLLMWMLTKDPGNRPQAREVETALQLAADQADWSVTDADVAKLVARALPERVALTAIPTAGGTELTVKGISVVPPSSLTPAPSASAPPPAATPGVPSGAVPPGNATLGRIAPRKMTAEALAAVKEKEAEEAAARAPPIDPWRDVKVAEHLVAQKKLTADQVQEAMAQAQKGQSSVNDALIALGLADEDDIVSAQGELTKTTSISSKRLAEMQPMPEALALLPYEKAEALQVVPLALKGTQLMVAMRDPLHAPTLEEVKRLTGHATFVAVRTGVRALHRTLGRFYKGIDEDDPSSWLETGAGVVTGEPLMSGGLEFEPSSASGEMQLDLRGDLPTAEKLNATLDDPQLRLFEAGLALMGEAGQHVANFVRLAGGVAKRLNVSDAELGRVRYVAAAIAMLNLTTRRPLWEMPKVEAMSTIAGRGWRSVEELVGRVFDATKPPASDAAALALQTALTITALAGTVRPTGAALANATQGLVARKFPKVAVEAARAECA